MTNHNSYLPIVEITRGGKLESLHRGAVAVVDARGRLVASLGNPKQPVFSRSAAKPFQALALVCSGGAEAFGFTEEEIALICGSHSGEAVHITLAESILRKAGLDLEQVLCGVHPPFDAQARRALYESRQEPSVLHNNCSAKHLGMLATAKHLGLPLESYIDPEHGVQIAIRGLLAFLAGLEAEEVEVGGDGCAAPAFYLPLRSFALALARLAAAGEGIREIPAEDSALEEELYDTGTEELVAEITDAGDPSGTGDEEEALPVPIHEGLRRIWIAMKKNPVLIAGSRGRLDTDLMRIAAAHHVPLIAKSGAEGVYAMAVAVQDRAFGITLKIEDGAERARNCAAIETLLQLEVLPEEAIDALAGYHQPVILNRRDEPVGEVNPIFRLNRGLPT